MLESYEELAARALRGEAPSEACALELLEDAGVEMLPLLQAAFVPRRHHFGRGVSVQVLDNLQNGLCPEDCGYCAQSAISQAPVRSHAMKSDEEIFAGAERAARAGAARYCMAMSGRGPSLGRTRKLATLIRSLKERYPIELCLSVGIMDERHTQMLAEAGLDRLNHNLNSSESHYPRICTTHRWADRLATLEAARRHGLEVCSGLIAGMGETGRDLVEVAFKLRELGAASIPVNFLIPIEGNPLQGDGSLSPEGCLRTLCMMRLVNPSAEIRVAAGREGHLRGLQSLALYPANSLFVGDYLTTRGDPMAETLAMIEDAGFEVAEIEGTAHREASGHDRAKFQVPGTGEALLRPELTR